MDKPDKAAKSSRRREENAPTSASLPGSESRPFGVAADGNCELDFLSRITLAIESIAADIRRITETGEKPSGSEAQDLPRKSYSVTEAAKMCGVTKGAIQYQIRIGNLISAPFGESRRLMILEEDLDNFLKARRRPLKEERAKSKMRT